VYYKKLNKTEKGWMSAKNMQSERFY